MGFEIPTSWFQSVNPLFIVLLAPVFASFWGTKMGQRLSTPFKMGMGMIPCCICRTGILLLTLFFGNNSRKSQEETKQFLRT